ncbi:RND transporter [Pseudoduganella eburnea]|uniref:RND transporter n=1 Tax=Massilia eburnea TaxID=1776165 RepID=A0A6L6QP26_9BURK|nr:TolC family protein [Massilia eburnea]MTW13647.1 RND transporter [Massilia eburnea]
MNQAFKLAALAAAAALLAGCATFSSDGGFGAVAQASKSRSGAETRLLRNDEDRRALDEQLKKLLAELVGVDAAVHVALLNNRSLQARYWDLGIAEAELVQAGRMANPGFSFKRTHGGGEVAIERTLSMNFIQLLTLPLASRIEKQRFEQVKLELAGEAVSMARQARVAWIEAVAAQQGVEYAQQISDAAEASGELAKRMQAAGNWSKYDAAREQAFHADAMADVARARKAATASRERLTRILGLSGEQATAYRLPARLPELPAGPRTVADAEATALRDRLDVQAARLSSQNTADALGLTRATRFINVLELSGISERDGERRSHGYEISLEVPLFDWGGARVAHAEATYMQSLNMLAAAATNASSEARESYQDYQASYELAKHYRDVVIPLRQKISEETLLRYNGMLLSVFELLADAREQAAAVNNTITALKEFWIADANLDAALGGKGVQP